MTRFGRGVQELVEQLQVELGWPDAREVDLEYELERLGAERAGLDPSIPRPDPREGRELQDDS